MRYNFYFFLTALFFHSISGTCQQNMEAACWEVLDIEFKEKIKSDNSLEVNFGAIFEHESGYSTTVPGFYNDNDKWIIRFCPSKIGEWTYQTYSSESRLSGKSGKIEVGETKKEDEHGPVMISRVDHQKFTYADGTPYFLLAFELDWLFALDWDNKKGIPRTEKIIEEVAKNKFNHIVMNVYAFDANWGERERIDPKYNFAEPVVFPFLGTNEKPDYTGLNIDFFKHLDRVIAHLDEKEIIAHLMIYVWNKKVNWPEPESKADNMYFDYVVKRYQAFPNLVWDISKEALAYGRDDMGYITRRIDRLRKLDGHDRLLSVHDYSYCNAFPGKVDFISIQEWRPNLYNSMLDVRKSHPNKPIFNIEHGAYEKTIHSIFDGAYNDPMTCLDRNYQCVFAGAYSTYYWQNSSWYEVVYEPNKLKKEQQPNFHYYHNIAKLFDKYDFTELVPHQHAFTPMTLTDHKDVYMYFAPANMLAITGTAPELKGKKVSITWFDALSGRYISAGERQFENGTWLGINKPDSMRDSMGVAILEVME